MILLLKLTLTPLLIGMASILGKVLGPGVGGLIVGLPLTSGPIAFILALEHGSQFARGAAVGMLSGVVSVVAFCIVYGIVSRRAGWIWSETGGLISYLLATFVLEQSPVTLLPLSISVFIVLSLAAVAFREKNVERRQQSTSPKWDLPARMVVATVFVLGLTTIAPMLGSRLSGLLAPFPIFVSVLAIFTHIFDGAKAARLLLHGVIIGLFSFAVFFIAIASTISNYGLGTAFSFAVFAALATQGLFMLVQRLAPKMMKQSRIEG